jgi:methylated-DNA-[protein]-cysteine S-methyltransferase
MKTPTDELEALLGEGPPSSGTGGHLGDALDRFRRAAAEEDLVDVAYATMDSPVGELVVAATPIGVVSLSWDETMLELVAAKVSPRILEVPARVDDARRQLDEYFDGRRRDFEIAVDLSLSAGFRREVLRALAAGVRFGQVVTYGELAERVGNPKASRAVGSAMASNPIPIIVPCHRVVRSGGALGNYSGKDGIVTKRFLLDLEAGASATLPFDHD